MSPNDNRRDDGFKPKWRHFHPQATVWVNNPLDHDVTFNVADEFDNPHKYRMRAGKTSELPGGAVATLGVKAIIDELIQNDPKDVFSQWEDNVRRKWEDKIILRIKEAPMSAQMVQRGEVDLSVDEGAEVQAEDSEPVSVDRPAFPERTQVPVAPPINAIAESSLPTANVVINED